MNVTVELVADRYELGEVVGRGRSSVYRARDTRLGREVAVKRVLVAPDPHDAETSSETPEDLRTRALREARAAARVGSPHAVAVYDVVEEGDAVWLVMELVPAPSLERLVHDGGPLGERRAAQVGLAVLDALTAAHAQGIVHRDVKPANVVVGTPVKLADFGIAALRDESSLTVPGLVVGSPSYMAPEQAVGGEVGPAADLWALGALLYFAIEGEPPFAAGSALATATAVVQRPFRPQQRPGRLSPVIARLLAKDPRSRPGAGAVRALLTPVAAGRGDVYAEPTGTLAGVPTGSLVAGPASPDVTLTGLRSAPPPGPGRGRRPARRLALAVAAAAAVVGAAAAATVAGSDGPPPVAPAEAHPAPSTTVAPPPTADTAGSHQGRRAPRTTPPPAAAPAASPAAPRAGKAAGASSPSGKGKAKGNKAAAAPVTTVATTPDAPTTSPTPTDPVVTEPPTTAPTATAPAPPTTVASTAGA